MLTTSFNRMLLYSLAVWNFATVSSLELPTDLHDSSWNYKSDEGNGFIIFYNEKMVFNGVIWNLVSLTGNFMSFQRDGKVTIDTSEKFLYKCWLYKRVTPSLYYFFPMTGMFQNQRAHVSADDPLDVCDYCTNTEAKLHILYPAGTTCDCTPECSQLTISNKCTGANHDTSSTNCVSGTTTTAAAETTTAIETTTTLPITTTLSSTTTKTNEAETTTLLITTTPLSSTTTKDATTALKITTTALSSTETTIKQATTIGSIYLTTTFETTDPPAAATTTTTTTAAALPTTILTLQSTAETPYDPITSTKPTTSRPDETNEETSTIYKKNISALDRIGLNEDAFVGVVSGSLVFVYLVVAIVGCACCVFILGRRRKRKRKGKESQENLVPEGVNHFQNKSFLDSLPQVFHRIDE